MQHEDSGITGVRVAYCSHCLANRRLEKGTREENSGRGSEKGRGRGRQSILKDKHTHTRARAHRILRLCPFFLFPYAPLVDRTLFRVAYFASTDLDSFAAFCGTKLFLGGAPATPAASSPRRPVLRTQLPPAASAGEGPAACPLSAAPGEHSGFVYCAKSVVAVCRAISHRS